MSESITLNGLATTAAPSDATFVDTAPFQNLSFSGLDAATTYTLTISVDNANVNIYDTIDTNFGDTDTVTDTGANLQADTQALGLFLTSTSWSALSYPLTISLALTAPDSVALGSEEVACFAAGTSILTARGEVAVESLAVGDHVVAVRRGGFAAIRWIGHRRIAVRRHPRPWDVNPIRLRAHAFGPDRPHRDLLLSPDHAVFVDGTLFRARDLLNGATIVQEDVHEIAYFHVELDRHDVLIANGLPAESFLDTGNRGAFSNGGAVPMAHPDFAMRVWEAEACAPLVWQGQKLAATRRALAARAERLGWTLTADPAPVLLAGGREIRPALHGDVCIFALPPCVHQISLVSRHGVPALLSDSDAGAGVGDARRLGLAIAGLRLDDADLALDDIRLGAGWHAPESGLRWTDGAATLTVGSARRLALTLAPLHRYWQPPPAAAAAIARAA
jgi:hypothetical protein